MSILLPTRALLFAAACAVALPLSAQTVQPASQVAPSPLDAKASVPSIGYESTFVRFKRWSDEKPVTWRQANDTVTGIGGWRAYAREAQQPHSPAPAASGGAKKP